MASFLARLLRVADVGLPAGPPDAFGDDDASVHRPGIDALAALGVVGGYPDGTFRPAAPVDRGQLASFVGRVLDRVPGLPPPPSPDAFGDDESSVHEPRIDQLAALGVVEGVAPGRFGPERLVTRSQTALFLARAADVATEEAGAPLHRLGVADATAAPELVGVQLDPGSGDTASVRFDFDGPVADGPVAGRFSLRSFAAEAAVPIGPVGRDPADASVLLVRFPRDAARLATAAAVDVGAVAAPGGAVGPEGAAALRSVGLASGTTAAPDLVGVQRLDASTLAFSFDEPVALADPTGYHVVLEDGTVRDGEAAGADVSGAAWVRFPTLGPGGAERVVRGWVEPGTVRDATGAASPQGSVDVRGSGSLDGVPDLVSVDIRGATVRATFDEAVQAASGGVRAYALSGAEVLAEGVAVVPGDGRAVEARFSGPVAGAGLVGASVDAGTVRSAASGRGNEVDELGLPQRFAAGETAAPDLLSAGRAARRGGRQVVFRFDASLVVEDPAGFAVVAADGTRTTLAGCAAAAPGEVVCPATSTAAARVAVAPGAVADPSRTYRSGPDGTPI